MAIATATSLDVHVGGKLLFADVSFKLEPGERMTLSGRNGAGKSTLLRVLAGELTPDTGSLTVQRGARLALHDQRPPRESKATLGDYVFSGRNDMLETEKELERLEGQMSEDAGEETMAAYAAAQQRLEAGGGYRWRDDVLAVLRGLGFGLEQSERSLSTFSGGELTRASLARALATRPDLLLLDEPTNHLDIPSLEWLEGYLVELDAAVVLVAHDRWFLEAVGTSVLELEAQRARFFAGPWHAWRQEQAARQIALGKAIDRQQAEIERMERFVERFRYKATKAKQAQSRIKQIDKKKRSGPQAERRDTRKLRFSFKPPERPGRVVLKLVKGRIEVPGRVLLSGAELEVERGEHVVLVGSNGSGKTTLIETLAGRREPASGSVRTGHNVRLGYLSQHADTAAGEGTVLDAAQRETGLAGPKARALLGGFLFSGADAEKQLSDISGGEQRRLSLAILVASGANVLILDEPTNHLDIESREALEDALIEFEGAIVLVSHDRALLEAVGTHTLVCEGGRLHSHPVGWATYEREREEADAAAAEGAAPARPPNRPDAKRAGSRGPSKNALRRIADLERRIEEAERGLRELEDELADPDAWASPTSAERANERHEAAKRELEELYAAWEETSQGAEPASTASE
ncbi:MAG: ribosomal protection-like ABC-F family protein [Solirubrobacterales bacterium]